MTLDPTIEARVRAKRAAPLDQDLDVLALLDEVERLRGVLEHLTLLHGAERALRGQVERERLAACKERDALRARAEKAERRADDAKVYAQQVADRGTCGEIQAVGGARCGACRDCFAEQTARVEKIHHALLAAESRAEKADEEKALRVQIEREREAACKERDAALAANAALRVALERLCIDANRMRERPRQGTYDDDLHTSVINARAAISAPAPGDGYVVLTREEAEVMVRAVKYADEDKMVTPGSTRLARCLDEMRALLRGKVKP